MRLYKPFTLLVMLTMLFATWVPAGAAPAASDGSTRQISRGGTTSFTAAPMASDAPVQNPEIAGTAGGANAAQTKGAQSANKFGGVDRSKSGASQGSGRASNGEGDPGLTLNKSFDGLYFRQQRLANNGNQYSVEPPDQGMCVGSGLVLETVNDVTRVYHKDGTPASGVEDLNSFYGYPPALTRPAGPPFGQFVTDPSCLFDQATQRFFNVVLTLDRDPSSGAYLGSNHLDIAVSQTSDPTGGWNIYRLPVQDDGTQGTPNHGCTDGAGHPGPCLGDYPHIGADANGFYITTNEYEFIGNAYIGAQIYAFSKEQLAEGAASVTVTQINTAHSAPGGHPGFTVWAAQSPANGDQNSAATANQDNGQHGTEYFLSSTAADEANCISGDENCFSAPGPRTSDNILLWTLDGTRSLNSASPSLSLVNKAVKVKQYYVPDPSNQKVGSTPLADCFNTPSCSTLLIGGPDPYTEVEGMLDSNDSRMQQVSFVNGQVWGALDTKVKVGGANQAGIEYFIVSPNSGKVVRQGTLGLAGNNLNYPAIGVTSDGRGVMAFTVVGNTHYPSAGYAAINANDGVGKVKIAAEGAGPQDGFTEYKVESPFGNGVPRPRWGDYGAAAVDGNTIWIASEYIGQTCTFAQYTATPFGSCGGTRASLGNWDTRISSVTP